MVVVTLALRYLLARARQSLLTVGGIVIGVLALTIMQAIMGGFRAEFVKKTLGTSPHITVRRKPLEPFDPASPTRALQALQDPFLIQVARPPIPDEEEQIRNPKALQERIRAVPGVVASAPMVAGQVMFGFSGTWEPVTVNGVVPSLQARVVDFAGKLKGGRAEDLERDQNGVVVGRFLAERMRVGVDDRIVAQAGDGAPVSLRIVAIHDAMVYDLDNTNVWVNLRRGQQLLQMGSAVNTILVKTADYNTADLTARRVEFAAGMDAESWMEANKNLLGLLNMIITIQFAVAGFTMAVAGFGIAGNLITTVSEKTFDIGVLKAMGMKSHQLSLVFVLLATLLMAIGLAVGLPLAYVLINLIGTLPSAAKPQPGIIVAAETMSVLQQPSIYLVAIAFASIVSLVAGLSPASRAARLEPLNIIRSGG